MSQELYEANARFVAEHARYMALAIGNARAMEYHGRILDLRAVGWVLFGCCPRCARCTAADLDCDRCRLVEELWVQLGDNGRRLLTEFLTCVTSPLSGDKDARPAEQFD